MKVLITAILFTFGLMNAPVSANSSFTLADYQSLKTQDIKTTRLLLRVMRESIFYIQESKGDDVICASPTNISGTRLIEMLDNEIDNPTSGSGRAYENDIPAAFIFVHALKNEGVCR